MNTMTQNHRGLLGKSWKAAKDIGLLVGEAGVSPQDEPLKSAAENLTARIEMRLDGFNDDGDHRAQWVSIAETARILRGVFSQIEEPHADSTDTLERASRMAVELEDDARTIIMDLA